MSCSQSLLISQGHTFEYRFRIGTTTTVLKPISALSRTAPATLTVPGHGLSNDWPYRIEQLASPIELNSPEDDPGACYLAEVMNTDTLRLSAVNGLALKGLSGSAGVIRYYAADDLTGLAARLVVRRQARGEVVATYGPGTGVTVDVASASVDIRLSATVTAAINWRQGVYELELYDPADTGKVWQLASGPVSVEA
ncbi:hypothetical protein SB18R_03230 [Pseudomonas oryzihabitans]|nr:hypothetical protein SB9_12465 [Pseudomonas psychrotolerans]KTT78258.1 hypothetical protein SB18R_03230 [Pseudomonas psychrotolerans]